MRKDFKEGNLMEDVKFCDYCNEPLNGQKPFIPVNSKVAYHWKCYIKKVKTEEVHIFSMEENEYGDSYSDM